MQISTAHFKKLVDEVVHAVRESLPPDLGELAAELIFTTADRPSNDETDESEELLGLYEGISLPDRNIGNSFTLPDRITLFRIPLMEMCDNEKELRKEIRLTVIHELGHFFGFTEHDLEERGLG